MKLSTHLLCAASLVAALGCGGSDRLETARVRGTVTLDGQPYTQGGSVRFEPEAAGKMATGEIQDDGSYELATYASGDGAVLGKHRVLVLPAPPQLADESPEAEATPPASTVPRKYESTWTSGLTFEVQPGQTNEYHIELTSR